MVLHEAKIVKGIATPDGGLAPFQVMALLNGKSVEAFKASIERCGDVIFGDITRFANVEPAVRINVFPQQSVAG